MDKRFKDLASNTLIFAAGSICAKFILFLLLPLYTNVLSTSEYGIAELITTFTTLLTPIISIGIGDAVLRFGLNSNYDSDSVIKNAVFVITLGSIAAIIVSPVFYLYKTISRYIPYLVVITILDAYRITFQRYAKARNQNIVFAIDNVIYSAILATSNILFLIYFNLNIDGYLLAQVCAVFASIVFLFFSTKTWQVFQNGIKPDYTILKLMLVFSAPLVVNSLSWWVIHSFDKIMLERMVSEGSVGLYSVSSKIPSLLNSVTFFFSQAWSIAAITEYDRGKDIKFFEKTFNLFTVVLTIGVALLLLVLKPFMFVYVGPEFKQAWRYVPFLLMAAVFRNYSDFFGPFFYGANKNRDVMVTTMIGAFINLILNWLLIQYFEIQGAVIATFVSYVIVALLRMFGSRKYVNMTVSYLKVLINLGSITLLSVFAVLDIKYYHFISMLTIIILLSFNKNYILEILNRSIKKR